MGDSLYRPEIFFQDILTGVDFFVSIVLFDSAPVFCALDPNVNSFNTGNEAERNLVWIAASNCRPLRMITMVALACHVAVITHTIQGDVLGVVDPRQLLFTNPEIILLSSIRFKTAEAAGSYVHLSCIGYHIVSIGRYGKQFLSPPKYSGTYIPFHREGQVTLPTPNLTKDVTMDIYGLGFTIGNSGSCCEPAQTSPFVCRPIAATREDRENFTALASVIAEYDAPSPVTNADIATANTDIGFYKTPFAPNVPTGFAL